MSAPDGSRTATEGTALPVDLSRDRRQRGLLAVVLAGPAIWSVHFLLVYLVAEAGCGGSGPGLSVFAPPVPVVLTIVATAVAAAACLASAWWAYRRWRPAATGERSRDLEGADPGGEMAFVGLLLALLSLVAVLFDGLPALFLGC